MFANAYNLASEFTNPVISSLRFTDDSVESSLGSFIILNDEGWILTAGHILNSFMAYKNQQKEISEHEKIIDFIKKNASLVDYQKRKKIQQLKKNFTKQKRIINHSF